MAGPEPGQELVIRGAPGQDLRLRRPLEDLSRALGKVPGRPPVDVAGMPQQVPDLPGRARRDRRVQPGPLRGVGEQGTLEAQRVDVLGDLHEAYSARGS